MYNSEDIKLDYNTVVKNLKSFKENEDIDYTIESTLENFRPVLLLFKKKDDRLKALIMLYMVNVRLEDLKQYDINKFKEYVFDTIEEKYYDRYNKLFELIEKGE